IAIVAAQLSPSPIVFAVYEEDLDAGDAFLMAQLGVRKLLKGPLKGEVLLEELRHAASLPLPELAPLVVPFLGRVRLPDFLTKLREEFVEQAITRTLKNTKAAARMLGIDRKVISRELAKRGESTLRRTVAHRPSVHRSGGPDDEGRE